MKIIKPNKREELIELMHFFFSNKVIVLREWFKDAVNLIIKSIIFLFFKMALSTIFSKLF
jgi:hypothetical protein